MIYITDTEEIKNIIVDLTETDILWVDTEVADYKTKKPRLSLIQILAYPHNLDGNRTYLLDVLDNSDLVNFFIEQIMKNETITKVFHNAKYDLQFLGKTKAKNILCTLELAQKIPYYLLPVQSRSLKTLTEYLTLFKNIDKEKQGSDWGIRPLSQGQLNYAKMDTVYLAQIYQQLIIIKQKVEPEPLDEDLESLSERYAEIEEQWQLLDSEINHLKERIKNAMIAQNEKEINNFKLSYYEKTTIKTSFAKLAELVNNKSINLDFSVTLTKAIQTKLADSLNDLEAEIDINNVYRLTMKNQQ